MANENYDYSGIEDQLKQRAAAKGVSYDASDLEGVKRNSQYDNGGQTPDQALQNQMSIYDKRASNNTAAPASNGANANNTATGSEGGRVTNAWSGQQAQPSIDPTAQALQTYLTQQATQQAAADAERKTKSDALFKTYSDRANQALSVNASDPVIQQQTDAYSATQARSMKNYLADLAERRGPNANLDGETRLANEQMGQDVSGFQAQLMGKELTARRAEIAQALQSQGSMLSLDQQQELQSKLANIDAMLKKQGLDQSGQLGNRGLDVQSQLGNAGLNLDWQKALMSNNQFMNQLGLNASEYANYNDLVRSGVIGG